MNLFDVLNHPGCKENSRGAVEHLLMIYLQVQTVCKFFTAAFNFKKWVRRKLL
jgi:hypothetical protein